MINFDITQLTPPPVSAEKRFVFYTDGGFFCISDGYLYEYDEVNDTWTERYHDNVLGVDKVNTKFAYSLDNTGVYCDADRVWLFAHYSYNNRTWLSLQYLDFVSGDVVGPYPLFWHNTQLDSYNRVYFPQSCTKDTLLYTRSEGDGFRRIYTTQIRLDRENNRFTIEQRYFFDDIERFAPTSNRDISYIGISENFDVNNTFFTNYDDLCKGWYESEYDPRWQAIDAGVTHQRMVANIMDQLGFITLRGSSDASVNTTLISRTYLDSTGNVIEHGIIGQVNKRFITTDEKLPNICNIYKGKLYISTSTNEFIVVGGVVDTMLKLGHMGEVIGINGYNSGFLPFKHLGHTFWMRECQNGDANQSPLVIKHKGTLHYISK